MTGAPLRYEPGPVKGLEEGAREDGLSGVIPKFGAPAARQCATLLLFPRTEYFDELDSVEELFKSQFWS